MRDLGLANPMHHSAQAYDTSRGTGDQIGSSENDIIEVAFIIAL